VRVLFDANILLDILLKRAGCLESALAVAQTSDPWLSTLSLANVCYVIGRCKTARIQAPLDYMRNRFSLASFTASSVDRSMALQFADFEDAVQVAIAEETEIPLLATRNVRDFAATDKVRIVSVEDLLQLQKAQESR